jgi:hypothetical protein
MLLSLVLIAPLSRRFHSDGDSPCQRRVRYQMKRQENTDGSVFVFLSTVRLDDKAISPARSLPAAALNLCAVGRGYLCCASSNRRDLPGSLIDRNNLTLCRESRKK